MTALFLASNCYAPLNPPERIERWQPQAALLSVAAGDRLGRPDEEVLDALEGYTVLRTDRNGWIELSTDGERLWVEVERKYKVSPLLYPIHPNNPQSILALNEGKV